MKKVESQVRAGKDPEQAIGWDWKFGFKVIRRGWKGPLFIVVMFNVVDYGRMYADTRYCFKRLSICKNYDQLKNCIRHIEYVRPAFREMLFESYEKWLDSASCVLIFFLFFFFYLFRKPFHAIL